MKHFLVVQLARFGDVVQTGRLLMTLCARGATYLCVDRSLVPLAEMLYPAVQVYGLHVHGRPDGAGFVHNVDVMARLRGIPFDGVYALNFSPLSDALVRLFPPEIVHGHRVERGQPLREAWTELGFRLAGERRAAPLNLVDFWAHLASSPLPPAQVNPPARAGGAGVGVVLAGRESRRSLPMDVLAPLAQTAFEATGGTTLVLLGSAAEKGAARQLRRLFPAKLDAHIRDLSGKTDWRGLADALHGLDAVLTPDTGTLHLAARLGVPVRAFFLSSAWCHETGPYGVGHHIWQTAFPCAPCLESAACPRDVACLSAFTSAELRRSLALSLLKPEGENEQLPAGLCRWRTAADALGTLCQPAAGGDDRAEERAAARALLAELRGLSLPCAPDAARMGAAARRLLTERDWMLEGGFAHV